MMRVRTGLAVFAATLTITLHAATPGGIEFPSSDRRQFVELSKTPEGKLLIAVFAVEKEGNSLQWTRVIEWEEPHPFWNSSLVLEDVKALVTNDGATVVVRDHNGSPQMKNGIRFIHRSENEDRKSNAFLRRELTGLPAPARTAYPQNSTAGMRSGISYLQLSAIRDFILDDADTYALWFGQTDQWLLISLTDGAERIAQEREMIDQLNDRARKEALETVARHQPMILRKAVNALREQVAKWVPSIGNPPSSGGYSEVIPAYLFLAARKSYGDREYIERLVHFAGEGVQLGHVVLNESYSERPLRLEFITTRFERLLGDFLLGRWNNETNREYLPRETSILIPHDSFRFLGSIDLDFELPISLPDHPGVLWIYVIPATVAAGDWTTSDEVIRYSAYLDHAVRQAAGRMIEGRGQAVVRGLVPGEYRVKMIWGRWIPGGGARQSDVYTAQPGDYEAVESAPLEVKAGYGAVRVQLSCTNRIGNAEAYALDDAWKQSVSNKLRKP